MGLWSDNIKNSKTDGFLKFIENQPCEVKYTTVDKGNNVFDIEGNLVIRQTDLHDGALKFKINKLDGDLILYCREFKPSIIPAVISGEILFRNPRVGNYTKTTRYKIGEAVYYIKDNKINRDLITKIILSSFINDKGDIEEDLTYYAGKPEYPLKESGIFTSREEVKLYLKENKIKSISGKVGEKYTCQLTEGDKVWIMENNVPIQTEITRVVITWEGNVYASNEEEEKKDVKIGYIVNSPKNGVITLDENKIFINKIDLINKI